MYKQVSNWNAVTVVVVVVVVEIVVVAVVVVSYTNQQMNTYKLFSYTCLLFLAPTYFGHSCDHIQGFPQYKYQE